MQSKITRLLAAAALSSFIASGAQASETEPVDCEMPKATVHKKIKIAPLLPLSGGYCSSSFGSSAFGGFPSKECTAMELPKFEVPTKKTVKKAPACDLTS